MIVDPAFSDLIGRIYDCALDPDQWPDVLGDITRALRGVSGDLQITDPLTARVSFAATHNWSDEVRRLTAQHFGISPGRSAILVEPLFEPRCTSRHFDIESFHASRFWHLCFAGRGYHDYLVVGLSRSVTEVASWGVLGSEDRGHFGDEDLELARLLTPHIKRAVDISGVLGHEKVAVGTLRDALDALAAAALILEPDGAVRFRNRQAEVEIGRGSVIRESQGRLTGANPGAGEFLAEILRLVPAGHHRGRDVLLSDASGRKLHATWAVLDKVGHELGSPILLVLQEPSPELRTPLGAAASAYGLTTAETQVLTEILDGRTLAEAADNLGVARSTVKTHLGALFRKTDTRRQSELVRAVLALASPLRS